MERAHTDSDIAREMAVRGGTILCLGVTDAITRSRSRTSSNSEADNTTTSLEFGIDCLAYETGPQFMGMKMIPPGIHYIYYSFKGKYGDEASRVSFFHNFKEGEVKVIKWNEATETFDLDINEDEQQRYAAGVKRFDFDKNLGPYPLSTDKYRTWISLSNFITYSLVDRLQPIGQTIYSTLAAEEGDQEMRKLNRHLEKQRAELKSEQHQQVKFEDVTNESNNNNTNEEENKENEDQRERRRNAHAVFYTPIPKQYSNSKMKKLTPEQITKYHFDKSFLLEDLLSTEYANDEKMLLGELQLAFVCFLLGQCLDGFNQWKNIVWLLCQCDEALYKRPELFINFINILSFQLQQAPEEFFEEELTSSNFLTSSLTSLFELIESKPYFDDNTTTMARQQQLMDLDARLVDRASKLKKFVEKRFGWRFDKIKKNPMEYYEDADYEDDEYAPVVVLESELEALSMQQKMHVQSDK